jgi:hypothetical protein
MPRSTPMNDDRMMTWREQGVANWARDCGYVMTKDEGRYHLSGPNPGERLLVHVELADIERYLESRR